MRENRDSNCLNPLKWITVISLCLYLLYLPGACAAPLEQGVFPSLVSSLRIDTPIKFCGEEVPIKNQEVRERLGKKLLLSLWDRPQVILWLKRSTRYLPYIKGR